MKNIVITGSSNGFGKLTALTMARKGHKVWATMRSANEKNLKAKEELLSIASAEGLKINVLEGTYFDKEHAWTKVIVQSKNAAYALTLSYKAEDRIKGKQARQRMIDSIELK